MNKKVLVTRWPIDGKHTETNVSIFEGLDLVRQYHQVGEATQKRLEGLINYGEATKTFVRFGIYGTTLHIERVNR